MASGQYTRQETDLLHPLAKLHWESCHMWNTEVCPTHCAVLHDKVAILTAGCGSYDVLYISTIDLCSWKPIEMPFTDMSLTTYKSKFVAVGGRYPPTWKPTNLLITSDTGQKWDKTLPSMPTERSCTSSVSTRSPEVLVVAGGCGNANNDLDVVEVLREDQWIEVKSLPAKCRSMKSTFHDGSVYFFGGGSSSRDHENTFTFLSLILSCEGTEAQKWIPFKAPGYYYTAVSHFSYLICINNRHNVRAYSNVTQSWVDATSTGNISHQYHHGIQGVTAAILPNGELVCAHENSGIYRVKLSGSLYNPETSFVPNVLSRLEAVMAIQIVSVLANNLSQLTTTSGVQLHPRDDENGIRVALPDPQKDPDLYTVEVISQWTAGHGRYSPTWRRLLEVLRDIGLSELSQQIETFMNRR